MKCLSKDADKRWQTASGIQHELLKWRAEVPPSAAAVQPFSVAVDGERKHATVLHCGVANAAALVERLGSASFHDLMAKLATIVGDEAARYEGILRQSRTDELIAVFGARIVHEDDARRAVLAALAIQHGLTRLMPGKAPDERPVARIGIDTGPVVVSRHADARGVEYSTIGETLRIADLLHQNADADTILISDATRQAVERHVDVIPTNIVINGLTAFRVIGPSPAKVHRSPRLARTLAPYVGRRHELGLLDNLAKRAREGQGHVVSVVGEPGMGKSRLLHEFARTVSDIRLLEGRCVSYGSLVPYLPLVNMVRTCCAVSEDDSVEDVRRAVRSTTRDINVPQDADVWLLRLLGLLEGSVESVSPEAVKQRTFDSLRALLLQAARRPLVIVVEDVHWIDRTSEEFLTNLIERLVAVPVLLIVTSRPGYRARWMELSYGTQISMTPLDAIDSETLIDAVARDKGLPDDASAAILRKAEGNPFFLEELAHAVIEHGPEHRIPDTVQGVIMARMDRLPDAAKKALQAASVLGREVPLRLLERVWHGASEVASELGELSRLDFLYERVGGDEPVLFFKHALTQDVAYDSLLEHRRRDLHLEAARALEELYPDRMEEMTATLAYHYARTDLIEEAVTWLIRAADQAARVYSNEEAILHLDLARRRVERLPEGAERDRRALEIALQQAHSLYFLGRWKESVEELLSHEARAARLNDAGLTAMLFFWLGHMYTRLGDQRRGAECAYRAIDAATRAGDDSILGKAHGVLSQVGFWSGNTHDGIAHGEMSVRLLRARPDQRWWLGMSHFYLAINYQEANQFEKGLAEAARADSVGREIGDPRLQTYAGYTTGWIEASRGRSDVAIAACRTSLEKAPDRVSRAYASLFLGYALLEHGEHAEALDRLQAAFVELERFEFRQWQSLAALLIGECLRLQRQPEEAGARVREGLAIATRVGYAYGVAMGERIAARIARDSGRTSEAAAAFNGAFDTFERIGATFEAARTRAEAAKEKARS
jgi:class 3 adenylate cyclase/tetratricopeptide (TPR) repeat protein